MVFAVVALHAIVASAQLPVIQIASLSQSAGQAGSEFDLTVAGGSHLDEIERLIFSAPGITSTLHTNDPLPFTAERVSRYGSFRVSIPADTKPSQYEVRALGRFGVSNPRTFVVTSLTVVKLEAASHDLSAPTAIERGVLYHSKATPEAVDFYSLKLDGGEAVRIDLLAQSLDSRMIGKVMVRDPAGRWRHVARGAHEADPYLSFKADQSGEHIIAVHDFIFAGGDECFYQLAVQTGEPPVSFAREGRLSRQPEAGTLTPDAVHNIAVVAEAPEAHVLSIPSVVSATFESAADVDTYRFDAVEGDAISISLESHRLRQPTDGRIHIERLERQADGTEVWHSVRIEDDSQEIGDAAIKLFTRDPAFLFQVPMTASYRLVVSDLDTGEALSPSQTYHLIVRRAQPDFSLVAYVPSPIRDLAQSTPQGANLLRGGTLPVSVMAVRRDGFKQPIRLSIEGLPEGVQCPEVVMASNQSQAMMTLVASDQAIAWSGSLRVIGKALAEATDPASPEIVREAATATVTWGRGAGRERIRARLCDTLSVAVSASDLMPLSFAPMPTEAMKGKKDSTIVIPVAIVRREGGDQPIVLRPQSLPPGVTLGEVTIPAGQSEAKLELKITAAAEPGLYCLSLQGETKVKMPLNPAALQRAEAYRAHLAQLLADPARAADHPAITAAVPAADQRVEAARASAQPQDRNVFLASPTIAIEIESP